MSGSDDSSRRYGDREIGLILKRATEFQDETPEPSGSGLTVQELEEIAVEAGIEPRHLRLAVAELNSGTPASRIASTLLGSSPTIALERVFQGEVSESVFERLVPEIQRVAVGQGVPSLFGKTLTWRSTTPQNTRSLQVTVSSRDGETQIRIEEQFHGLAGGLFGGLVGGGGTGIGLGVGIGVGVDVLSSVLFAVAFPLVAIGWAYALARTIFGSLVRRRRQALHQLMQRLEDIVEAELSSSQIADGGTQPRIGSGEPAGES